MVCEERLVSLVANLAGWGEQGASRGGRGRPDALFEKVYDYRALVECPGRVEVVESECGHEALGRQLEQLCWLLVGIDFV